ncbi:MAG: rane integrity-associated transporter subunit PqiC [Herminiimonas sp.]|nr:rane integrity-associated transporter subunit PqiC [Herminiimonas sp.]
MRISRLFVSGCCAVMLLAACGTTTPRERFYTLNARMPDAAGNSVKDKPAYVVFVGSVSVPELVDRPQLVIRVGPNQVQVLEQHLWAGSLRKEIARVIVADLDARLSEAYVTSSTDYASRDADYRISVDIGQFDATPGQGVTVQAAWTIRRMSGGAARSGRSLVRESIGGSGYDDIAAAYGRALSAVSNEVGNAVQSFQGAVR